MLLRIILMGLALAGAGLEVAWSLSMTPSSVIVRSIPVWETTDMPFPRASDDTPASSRPSGAPKTSPHALSTRDIV